MEGKMTGEERYSEEKLKYLELLSEQYPGIRSVYTEIINLMAIMNLPKGTEHFMSDLHGEYEAFYHILNNCSGVIREKVDLIFSDRLSQEERRELCTLIYYPKEKLEMIKRERGDTPQWYMLTLRELMELSKLLASKYTRSKVRKALPQEFAYVIDELLHAQPNEEDNRHVYHEKIMEAIIGIDCNVTDFYAARPYPVHLYYNPYMENKTVTYTVSGEGPVDLFDIISRKYLAENASGTAKVTLPADNAAVIVEVPAGTDIVKSGDRLVDKSDNNKIISYR